MTVLRKQSTIKNGIGISITGVGSRISGRCPDASASASEYDSQKKSYRKLSWGPKYAKRLQKLSLDASLLSADAGITGIA